MAETYEEAGLLADIREDPTDVALRRIHADWLEEHGQEGRACFIRLMLDRAAAPRQSAAEATLRRAAHQLLRDNWTAWTAPFKALMGKMPGPVAEQWKSPDHALASFPLGLLEWLRVDARVLLDRGEALFALSPLRRLDLYNPAECGLHLGACRVLRWVETLAVTDRYIGPLDAAAMASLARSPHLGRLRELWLPHGSLGDRGADSLAAAPWLPGLSSLGLSDNGLSREGGESLAGAEGLRPAMLDLSLNELGDAGLTALIDAGTLDRVTDLRLIECVIGDPGITSLAGRWSLAGPESMYLRDNGITDAGAEALAAAPWVGSVRFLDLADNRVGPAGRAALAHACGPDARIVA
jgi:uncharacterized protein (TIGR02996 family)